MAGIDVGRAFIEQKADPAKFGDGAVTLKVSATSATRAVAAKGGGC